MRIIAGEARGRTIDAPPGRNTRPTLDRVRENLFNMIQGEVRGREVLDLFAGSGALSLEAISRGATRAVLADHDRNAAACQRKNIERLGYAEQTAVMTCDWRKALTELQRSGSRFGLVFLDPPYAMTDLRDVFAMLVPVLEDGALVVAEHEAGKEITADSRFACCKQRSWGFCAVSMYRLSDDNEKPEVIP